MNDWDWNFMFAGVQKIVQSAANPAAGFQQLLAFAAQNRDKYPDTEFWQSVAASDMPFDTLKSWAKEGLDRLTGNSKWSQLALLCGDGPDLFGLVNPHFRQESDFNEFLNIARSEVLLWDFENYPPVYADVDTESAMMLARYHISELEHPLLNWSVPGNLDSHGFSGYLLWSFLCTMALSDVLRDTAYCRVLAREQGKIIVMSGFESIFFYVGTISSAGFQP